jgi:hypothetical protein
MYLNNQYHPDPFSKAEVEKAAKFNNNYLKYD